SVFRAWLVLELAVCGTIIYPERRGQASCKIDPAVVIMDGIGLLFWAIPGLVAFAVDFATGAIYSPSGRFSVAPEVLKPATNDAGAIDTVHLPEIINPQTRRASPFNHPNIQQQDSSPELLSQLSIVPSA